MSSTRSILRRCALVAALLAASACERRDAPPRPLIGEAEAQSTPPAAAALDGGVDDAAIINDGGFPGIRGGPPGDARPIDASTVDR